MQFTIGVVLLFNISIDTLYVPVSSSSDLFSSRMQIKGGVISLNDSRYSWFHQFPDSYIQAAAVATFGVSRGASMDRKVGLTQLGTFGQPDCALGADACDQLYISQAPPDFIKDLPPVPGQGQTPAGNQVVIFPFLKVFKTPIYHVLNKASTHPGPLNKKDCRFYGYPANVLGFCAKEFVDEKGKISLFVGTSTRS